MISLDHMWHARLYLDRCVSGPICVSMAKERQSRSRMTNLMDSELAERATVWGRLLRPYTDRMENLNISHSSSAFLAFSPKMQDSRFSMLTDLSLECNDRNISDATRMVEWKGASHDKFPRLSCIDLYSVYILWTSGVYKNLVELGLHSQWVDEEPSPEDPPIEDFITILAECPELRLLSLEYCGIRLPIDAMEYPEPKRVIDLRRLETLCIIDKALTIAYILASITFPRTVFADLAYYNFDCSEISEVIPALFPRNRTLFTILNDVRKAKFNIGSSNSLHTHIGEKTFSFTLAMWEQGEEMEDVLDHAFGFISPILLEFDPLIAVEDIEIGVSDPEYRVYSRDWDGILALVPSLRTLTFTHARSKMPDITNSQRADGLELCDRLAVEGELGAGLPCRGLEVLELRNIDFEQTRETDGEVRLLNCLRVRQSRGCVRLKLLKLTRVRKLKEEAVELMKEYVDQLEWAQGTILSE